MSASCRCHSRSPHGCTQRRHSGVRLKEMRSDCSCRVSLRIFCGRGIGTRHDGPPRTQFADSRPFFVSFSSLPGLSLASLYELQPRKQSQGPTRVLKRTARKLDPTDAGGVQSLGVGLRSSRCDERSRTPSTPARSAAHFPFFCLSALLLLASDLGNALPPNSTRASGRELLEGALLALTHMMMPS